MNEEAAAAGVHAPGYSRTAKAVAGRAEAGQATGPGVHAPGYSDEAGLRIPLRNAKRGWTFPAFPALLWAIPVP